MTARQLWEGLLIELSKVNAPSILLDDFNHFCNKAIGLNVNKSYNFYDINLQITDNLRVLSTETILSPIGYNNELLNKYPYLKDSYKGIDEVVFPSDYLHLLNCTCIFKVLNKYKCYNKGEYVKFHAKRITSDTESEINNNYYNRPLPERPYYYIHNINSSDNLITNLYSPLLNIGTDLVIWNNDFYQNDPYPNPVTYKEYVLESGSKGYKIPKALFEILKQKYESEYKKILLKTNSDYYLKICLREGEEGECSGFYLYSCDSEEPLCFFYESSGQLIPTLNVEDSRRTDFNISINKSYNQFPRKVESGFSLFDLVDKPAYSRISNSSMVRCEIRYGDNSNFELVNVIINYIKSPQNIKLTQELIDLVQDTSQILEFPDYVCQEILNELVKLIMENTVNPRLETNAMVTLSIASPVQQLTTKSKKSQS